MTELSKKIILSQNDIAKLSSEYLNEGRKQETWEITYVEIEEKTLTARVRMLRTSSLQLTRADFI